MANGDFAATVKLGSPTRELSLTLAAGIPLVYPFRASAGEIANRLDNLVGDTTKVTVRKSKPRYTIRVNPTTKANRDALLSMAGRKTLSFIFADNWAQYSDDVLTDTTGTLTLPSNSFVRLDKAYSALGGGAILSGFKVFAVDDPLGAPGGTDYYAGGGGSYNRTTGVVTLNSSPGAAGTQVYVTYLYTGALVRFSSLPVTEAAGRFVAATGLDAWECTFELEGL